MRFDGKFATLCYSILVLVFLFPINAGGQVLTAVKIRPSADTFTVSKPIFECVMKAEMAYGLDSAFGVVEGKLRFWVNHVPLQVGGHTRDTIIWNGVVRPGYIMLERDSVIDAHGNLIEKRFVIGWDPQNPAHALPEGRCSYLLRGYYLVFVRGETERREILFFLTNNFRVSNTPTQANLVSVATQIIPELSGFTGVRPSFEFVVKPDSDNVILPQSIPNDSLRFEIINPDSSLVVFNRGSLLDGFEIDTTFFETATYDTIQIFPLIRDTIITYYAKVVISWDPANPADPLAEGEYSCKIYGKYSNDRFWGASVQDSVGFTVFSTAPQIAVLNEGYTNTKGEFDFSVRSFGTSFGNFLDTTNFYIDLYLVDLPNSPSEERRHIETISPDKLRFKTMAVETVGVGPNLNLLDGIGLDIFIYDGTTPEREAYIDSADWSTAYSYFLSCQDLLFNKSGSIFKRLIVDALPPQITMLDSTDKAWRFYLHDVGSGVENNSVVAKENGEKITSDKVVQYDSTTHILTYYPLKLGALFSLAVKDRVKNMNTYSTYVQSGRLAIYDVHAFPNPFNPVKGERAQIAMQADRQNVEKSAEVYDLEGKHVATLSLSQEGELFWDGRTDGGELVANGVYLCYVSVKDSSDLKIQKFLLKIAVVKKD